MTQLDLLVSNVAELLATAVHEVLHLMGQAVSEYREESSRMRLENQKLQRKVEELQQRLESDAVQHVSFSVAVKEPSLKSDGGQVLDCGLEEGQEVTDEDEERQNLSFDEEKFTKLQLDLDARDVNSQSRSRPPSPACVDSGQSVTPFSQMKGVCIRVPTSPSPDRDFESYGLPNNIKMESSPDPPECSTADSMNTHDPTFGRSDKAPLEDVKLQHPYSSVHSVPQNQHHPAHTRVLSPRTENTVDVPNVSGFNSRREGLHACHVCGKTFATSSSLGAHFVCHSSERPFSCQCCQFSFSRLADLKKHERIHTGERPYCCSVCGRRFNRTENLRRHLRKVHHGVML